MKKTTKTLLLLALAFFITGIALGVASLSAGFRYTEFAQKVRSGEFNLTGSGNIRIVYGADLLERLLGEMEEWTSSSHHDGENELPASDHHDGENELSVSDHHDEEDAVSSQEHHEEEEHSYHD